MPISDHIACPRCKEGIGAECVQRDPDDPSDAGQHSDRIHAFIAGGSLEDRVTIHLETEEALRKLGWDSDGCSLFLNDEEIAALP